jgi:hypothetical protein
VSVDVASDLVYFETKNGLMAGSYIADDDAEPRGDKMRCSMFDSEIASWRFGIDSEVDMNYDELRKSWHACMQESPGVAGYANDEG